MEIRWDVKILSLKTHLNTELLLETAQRMPVYLHRDKKVSSNVGSQQKPEILFPAEPTAGVFTSLC